jgi:adenosyl cobinamide kinase/adenosyl cobinamide phosphate guanylyltransferase
MMSKLYDSDFYGWTKTQAQLLREEKWQAIDKLNLIEEIEALGRQERRELINRLALLLGHLLKWQYQPEKRSNSWLATIREQRTQIKRILADSPSLKSYLEEALQLSYEDGINLAVKETNLPYETFPETCNYGIIQILDNEFLPDL